MKKILPILTIGILVLSGLGAVALPIEKTSTISTITKMINISPPAISENEDYLQLTIAETTNTLQEPGKPEMPLVSVPIDLPFRSQNIKISCIPRDEYSQEIRGKIKPTPQTIILSTEPQYQKISLKENFEIYQSTEYYPTKWYDYKISCGLNNENKQVTHISLYLFPVRYSPIENAIAYTKNMDITITYEPPSQPQTFRQEYDLVIIAPQEFEENLQPLVTHKNDHGMDTILKTTEDIYAEYTGVDKPEQIKKFIYDYKENHNITYVLLVGGLKSYYNANDKDDMNQGSTDWHLPVRYTNIKISGGEADYGAVCDLYYADIYNATGEFHDWDTNDDGIIAHWGKYFGESIDELDLNPDVYVSRLACRNNWEVKTCVKKIIGYESTSPASKSWMKSIIGIAGKTHFIYSGQPDGEYISDTVMTYMEDMTNNEVRVYASHEGTSDPYPIYGDIIKEISKGAGFVLMTGHGNPFSWNTHKLEQGWTGGITTYGQMFYHNFKKLPVILVGGCHNAQFNVTWYQTKHSSDDDNKYYWTYDQGTPVSFCWEQVMLPWGGAIASIGNSGLGIGTSGGNPITLSHELEVNVFYQIGQNNAPTFGQAHGQAITKYIDENTIGNTEAHCITIYAPLGDPSLMFGGYE